MKKIIPLVFLFFIFSINLFGQRTINGTIAGVIDGRTFEVTAAKTTYVVELPFIAIPDPDQQLSSVVKDHATKFLLNNPVKVIILGIAGNKMQGQVFVGDVDISLQMLRDGAAWYNIQQQNSQAENDRQSYLAMESAARQEKRGVWGIEGMKPVWEFRAEKDSMARERERAKIESINEENSKVLNKIEGVVKRNIEVVYPNLPPKIQNISYIDYSAFVPKGFAVVGVGYLENDREKLVKAIKKPKSGDLTCNGFEIPPPYVVAHNSISNLCPSTTYGNNASYIEDVTVISKALTKTAINKTILAYRMYKISGNYEEFKTKAIEAISAVSAAIPYMPDGQMKSSLFLASQALTDSMLVKSSRNGVYGASLSGSALIALNDKYGLRDVSAYLLDDAIINTGVGFINTASREAQRLGIIQIK